VKDVAIFKLGVMGVDMADPHISFRKPKCIIEQSTMSWSNKYYLYLGRHYHEAGKECWIVGAINTVTSEDRARHYNTFFGSNDPKAEALIFWQKFFEGMTKAPETEEKHDWEIELQNYLGQNAKRKGYTNPKPNIIS
jgi:hypothetical protein